MISTISAYLIYAFFAIIVASLVYLLVTRTCIQKSPTVSKIMGYGVIIILTLGITVLYALPQRVLIVHDIQKNYTYYFAFFDTEIILKNEEPLQIKANYASSTPIVINNSTKKLFYQNINYGNNHYVRNIIILPNQATYVPRLDYIFSDPSDSISLSSTSGKQGDFRGWLHF